MVDLVDYSTLGASRAASLLREVGRLHVAVQRATTSCCGGKTTGQCNVLGELSRSGALGIMELSERLAVHKAWTSRTVAALEREGLVSRCRADHDGRAIHLALTAKGRERWRALDSVLDKRAGAVLARVPRPGRAGVFRALQVLCGVLSEELHDLRVPSRPTRRLAARGSEPAARGRERAVRSQGSPRTL